LGVFETGSQTAVTALAFNHGGTRLAAATMAGADAPGRIVAWDVGAQKLAERACEIASRNLVESERDLYSIPAEISVCEDQSKTEY